MEKMKKYDKYKNSEIEWIGEIPEHWNIATIGRFTNLGRGRVISHTEISEHLGDYPVYSSQTENNGIMGKIDTFDFDGKYVTWTTDGANAGTVFYRDGKFNCTNVCGTIQPKDWNQIDLQFIPYYLNLGTKFSVRLDINPKLMNNMMSKIPLVIPPIPEQKAIADFLDHKTSEIERLIEIKEKLVKLYEESKTAIINQAVTKGIDPDVEYKVSGIEWVGDIPENWEVKRLKYVAIANPSNIDKKSVDGEKEIFLCNYTDVYNNNFIDEKIDFMKATASEAQIEKFLLKKGDVIATKDSETPDDIGVPALVVHDFDNVVCGYHLTHIKPNKIRGDFLFRNLQSQYNKAYFEVSSNGVTRYALGVDKIDSTLVVVPSIAEQKKIVKYIESETGKIDLLIDNTKKLIELMKEYKAALISEVVTGKIKVTE